MRGTWIDRGHADLGDDSARRRIEGVESMRGTGGGDDPRDDVG